MTRVVWNGDTAYEMTLDAHCDAPPAAVYEVLADPVDPPRLGRPPAAAATSGSPRCTPRGPHASAPSSPASARSRCPRRGGRTESVGRPGPSRGGRDGVPHRRRRVWPGGHQDRRRDGSTGTGSSPTATGSRVGLSAAPNGDHEPAVADAGAGHAATITHRVMIPLLCRRGSSTSLRRPSSEPRHRRRDERPRRWPAHDARRRQDGGDPPPARANRPSGELTATCGHPVSQTGQPPAGTHRRQPGLSLDGRSVHHGHLDGPVGLPDADLDGRAGRVLDGVGQCLLDHAVSRLRRGQGELSEPAVIRQVTATPVRLVIRASSPTESSPGGSSSEGAPDSQAMSVLTSCAACSAAWATQSRAATIAVRSPSGARCPAAACTTIRLTEWATMSCSSRAMRPAHGAATPGGSVPAPLGARRCARRVGRPAGGAIAPSGRPATGRS